MRTFLLLSLILVAAAPMIACSGSMSPPSAHVRWPLLIDPEPMTAAQPRLVQTAPQYVAPSYQLLGPPAGSCAPSYSPAGSSPCDQPSGYHAAPPPALPPGYHYSR